MMAKPNSIILSKYLKGTETEESFNNDELLFIKLLDQDGYLYSYIKFEPSFLKKLKEANVRYFAFKKVESNSDKYFIVLKKLTINLEQWN